MVCQKMRHGLSDKSGIGFITGEQKKAAWVSEKAAWVF